MSTTAPVAANSTGYFVDNKKGEVNELKQLLKNINVERDANRKRDIIKKVIACMTLGIDVSRLFTDMIMAIETKDMVVKKMVYLYLCNYAHKEPEMGIMCINTMRRDCDNEDPMVRGLALRSLCNLRMESMLEYVEVPLKKSLTDISPYVRKTAVMCVIKLNALSPAMVEHGQYIATVHKMLHDTDTSVITNALMVLEEFYRLHGGIPLTSELIMHLLNRIGEFSEWGVNIILDLLSRYTPASEDETFAIMNVLDPLLRTANSGAVLGTIKCFIILTRPFPDIQTQVYQRAKPPMLTFITGGVPEIQYAILKHLEVILQRPAAKGLFDDEYRQLFVRYHEPTHVKYLKVDLLPYVVNEENAREVAAELGEYVTDVDAELSKRAIASLGEIAMRVTVVSADMTQRLVELVNLDMPYVRAEAVKVLGNVIRIFPDMRAHVLPFMSRSLKRVEDPEALAVLVWMLGEYGKEIIEAPYMLEPIIDNYSEEQSLAVKLQILTSAMKLFFKRPPEMQHMLGRLLAYAVNDTSNQDLHDRALLYYRMLQTDVFAASNIFKGLELSNNSPITTFAESMKEELRTKVFDEFNSLAVIYGKPCVQFIKEAYLQVRKTRQDLKINGTVVTPASSAPATTVSAAPVQSVNLLDWDDQDYSAPASAPSAQVSLSLEQNAEMSPQQFQQLWTSLPDAYNGKLCVLSSHPSSTNDIEDSMRSVKVHTMASGAVPSPPGLKYFLYAVDAEDILAQTAQSTYLVQLITRSDTGDVDVVIKTNSPKENAVVALTEVLRKGLSGCGVK